MLEFSDDFRNWIKEHSQDNVLDLKLKYQNRFPRIDDALCQIQARQCCKHKLSETLSATPDFYFPNRLAAEQSTSDQLASFHASLVPENSTVLDMTCGLGIDTFHIARRAASVTAVERQTELCQAAEHNAAALGLDNVTIIEGDSVEYLKNQDHSYDVIFIDPARRGDEGERLYNIKQCRPNVLELLDEIRQKSRRLIVKLSPMIDVTETIRDFGQPIDLYVVSDSSECKELLAVLDFDSVPVSSTVHVWNPSGCFQFCPDDEAYAVVSYGEPQTGQFIYEPSAGCMKAAPFKLISDKFNLKKASGNSHVYFSSDKVTDFPGTIRKIVDVVPFNSKDIKSFHKKYPKADVAVRNFRMTAVDLVKKLKLKEGGPLRILATTIQNGDRLLIVSEPLSD